MKKKILACVMIMSILSSLTGCGSASHAAEIQMEAGPELTVYAVENIDFYEQAVTAFQGRNEQMQINYVTFETQDDLARQYSNDVAMGTQPDVLLLTDDTMIDVFKACKNYRFADLTPYFEGDNAFYRSNYFEEALDAGCYEEKQYIVPFRMETSCYVIPQKLADAIDVKALREVDGLDLMKLLMQEADDVKAEGIMDGGVIATDVLSTLYIRLLRVSGTSLGKLQDEGLNINQEQIKLLGEFSKYVMADTNYQAEKSKTCTSSEEMIRMFGVMLLGGNPFYIARNYEMVYDAFFDEEVNVLLATSVNEPGTYHADITRYGVVDADSSNVRGAYQLLRYLMDYKSLDDWKKEIFVNRSNTRTEFVNVAEATSLFVGDETITVSAMRDSQYQQIEKLMDNLKDITIPNPKVEEIYQSVTVDYFAGDMEFEDMYLELQNRLNIYWKE